jgi:hypothetical protein
MITQQWKVENDSNEYNTEQEAQIAECLQEQGAYLTASEKLYIAKQVSKKYILIPIPQAIEVLAVTQAELDQREPVSYGPSA